MRDNLTRRNLVKGVGAMAALSAMRPTAMFGAEHRPFRIGLSLETLAGANVNDARAAYRVWSQEVARGLDLTGPEILPEIFLPSARLIELIRAGAVDCFALTAWEYSKTVDLIDQSQMMVEDYAAKGLDYLILTHAGAGYRKLEDLRGTKLLIHHHRDTLLLETWLSVALANAHLPAVNGFFEAVEHKDNINEVILPLFFKRVPAIGIARRAFEMAVELNPQLGRDLIAIASSPKVVGDGFFFRRGCDPVGKAEFQKGSMQFKNLPAGRQCLALYQSTGFFLSNCSIMNGSMDLIRQYERIQKTPRKNANG